MNIARFEERQHRGYDDQTQNFTTKQKKIQQNPGSEKKDVIPIHFFGLIESIHPQTSWVDVSPGKWTHRWKAEDFEIGSWTATWKMDIQYRSSKSMVPNMVPEVCWAVCWDLFEVFKSCSSGRCRYINCQCDILFDMIYHIIAHNDVTWFDFILIW